MTDGDSLTAFSWVALATFLVVIVFVIYPVRISLRTCGKPKWSITLNIATAPIIGILFLLATTAIPPYVVLRGFLGSAGIQPWGVMILVRPTEPCRELVIQSSAFMANTASFLKHLVLFAGKP
jgi:hypothetical protein